MVTTMTNSQMIPSALALTMDVLLMGGPGGGRHARQPLGSFRV
jgi:hypothetical protein